ncbi:MAG TPA: hypothetical protein VMS64_31365 [Candidatus Methylomirabilis sp.]|nr:hypothetical protein [Candidatus Methylomirabilis sp.]
MAMARAAKHRSVEVLASVLGEGYLRTGHLEAARTTLEQALWLCEEYGMKYAAGRIVRSASSLWPRTLARTGRRWPRPPSSEPWRYFGRRGP